MKIKADYSNDPQWREVNVKSTLPKELSNLNELAHNLWWAWNYEARNMWKALDENLYEEVGHNPVLLLDRLSYERKEAIVKDKSLMKKVNDVYKSFREYMDVAPDKKRPSVAYFCMEYGLNHGMKRMLYVSSGEVYGEGDGRVFTEDYSGYVNCTSPRSCYPSSKRAAENL